ncbi:hypothetical protein GQX73_g9618 [Xylaria multiplex]|uniref:Uncharacterized protein n=1 Tax=Xylaria multiplex TaxID=323545 RepID=A0A7C8IHR9_9PEZI|nr:hypothetical protein GQX73_g9618 [Xylaria multiplex]
MQFKAYISILVALAGVVSSAPTPADSAIETPEGGLIKKSANGRFKPVWVVGFDEDEEKGEHIGFRLIEKGGEGAGSHAKSHGGHAETSSDEKQAFWYYY